MKHTLFACLLLGVTLGFCIFSSVTVRAETQAVNDAIASSRNAASRDDFQSAADSLQAPRTCRREQPCLLPKRHCR